MTTVSKQSEAIGDEQFVTSLYRALLGREPDASGLQAHLIALSNGLSREELRTTFLTSNEHAERSAAASGMDPRTLYALLPYPIWRLEDITNEADGTVTVRGWALGHRDQLALSELTLNGTRAANFDRKRAPEISARMPWFLGSTLRFTATFTDIRLEANRDLHFSLVRAEILEPFNRWQDVRFPVNALRQNDCVMPDAARLARSQDVDGALRYAIRGHSVGYALADVISTYFGREISHYHSICDWGCGYGPVLQAVHRLAPDSSITGIDSDADCILWNRENLKFGKFRVLPLVPPSALPAEQFDLLYGISTFSRLNSGAFENWRDEIHRIVRPGGIVLVTLQTAASLAMSGSRSLVSRTLAAGFGDTSGERLSGTAQDTHFGGTYVTPRRACEILGEKFSVRDIVPLANFHQDLAVCERP